MKGVFYLSKDNYNMEIGGQSIDITKREIKTTDFFDYVMEGQEVVKVVKQGKYFADVIYQQRKPKPGIKKISKTEYVELKTGEIKQFNLVEGKSNPRSLRMTFVRLIGLIRANFSNSVYDSPRQKVITLTYAENMTDSKKLMKDFQNFYYRLKRKYPNYKFEYVAVAEPQARGAWHMHLLLKIDKRKFIPCHEIKELWGHGRTWTERLKANDAGRYYVSYFTNLEKDDMTKKELKSYGLEAHKQKKYIKGARLKLYPKNFNFYRCSQNIKRPVEYYDTWENVIKEYGQPDWQKSYQFYYIENGKMEEVNLLHKASFKKELKQDKTIKEVKDIEIQ